MIMLRSLFARFVQTAARRPALGSFDGDRRGRSPIRASRTSRGVRPCSGSAGFVEQRLAAFELVVAFPPARPPVEQLRLLCFVEQRLAAFELVVAFPPVEQLRLLGCAGSRGCCVRRVGARPRFAPARCFPARAARAWLHALLRPGGSAPKVSSRNVDLFLPSCAFGVENFIEF